MKNFEIWTEGYAATGQSSDALFRGIYSGDTFKDAVETALHRYSEEDIKTYYDPENMSWWGCKFFDNEIDARKSFG